MNSSDPVPHERAARPLVLASTSRYRRELLERHVTLPDAARPPEAGRSPETATPTAPVTTSPAVTTNPPT